MSLVLFGQGCASSPSPVATERPDATPQPLREPPPEPPLRVNTILGIALPASGIAVFNDSVATKQDGALFYGPAYRLAWKASEPDRLVGQARVLNVTDPTRNPDLVLRDPMRLALGCVDDPRKFGPQCDIRPAVTSTIGGLVVRTYPVRYKATPSTPAFSTSSVWLVAVPKNERAWVYVTPADLGDSGMVNALANWMRQLTEAK